MDESEETMEVNNTNIHFKKSEKEQQIKLKMYKEENNKDKNKNQWNRKQTCNKENEESTKSVL